MLISWVVLIIAILQFSLLAESGDRFGHGNWGWARIPASYILFLFCIRSLFKEKRNKKFYLVIFVLFLHFLSGLLYLLKVSLGFGYA